MARKCASGRSRKNKHGMNKRKTCRRRGGAHAQLMGAPLGHSLAGDYSSKMSMGQGADFMKYHQGQHGGQHGGYLHGAPLSAIEHSVLDGGLRGAAHLNGLDKAFNDIKGLSDQAGGKHRRRSHRRSHKHRQNKSQKGGKKNRKQRKQRSQRSQRRQGGALGFAPLGSDSMLLKSPMEYAQAGLSSQWKTSAELNAAHQRAAL